MSDQREEEICKHEEWSSVWLTNEHEESAVCRYCPDCLKTKWEIELLKENEGLKMHLMNIAIPHTQQAQTKAETERYRKSIDYAIKLKEKAR